VLDESVHQSDGPRDVSGVAGPRCSAAKFISGAAEQVGAYRKQGSRWVAACGGVRPRRGRDLKGRCLTFAQREEIALGIAGGETIRAIARRLGHAPSTVSRELTATPIVVAAVTARQALTRWRMTARADPSRPSSGGQRGAARVRAGRSAAALLTRADRRALAPPVSREPEMWVSTETIYQSLYVQSRVALRRQLTACAARR